MPTNFWVEQLKKKCLDRQTYAYKSKNITVGAMMALGSVGIAPFILNLGIG